MLKGKSQKAVVVGEIQSQFSYEEEEKTATMHNMTAKDMLLLEI